jgi:pSer/pThr/pTyr-binding forkhead associated (FHA) protein
MVQLKILSGKKAGAVWTARRFPVRIGRAANADLRLEEDGIWDRHLLLQFRRADGFVLTTEPDALVAVNGEPVRVAVLRNGDSIELGALKLQFWLSETRQFGLGLRETLTWMGIALVGLGQVGLIYWLLR